MHPPTPRGAYSRCASRRQPEQREGGGSDVGRRHPSSPAAIDRPKGGRGASGLRQRAPATSRSHAPYAPPPRPLKQDRTGAVRRVESAMPRDATRAARTRVAPRAVARGRARAVPCRTHLAPCAPRRAADRALPSRGGDLARSGLRCASRWAAAKHVESRGASRFKPPRQCGAARAGGRAGGLVSLGAFGTVRSKESASLSRVARETASTGTR